MKNENDLNDAIYCTNCKHKLNPNNTFCSYCGNAISQNSLFNNRVTKTIIIKERNKHTLKSVIFTLVFALIFFIHAYIFIYPFINPETPDGFGFLLGPNLIFSLVSLCIYDDLKDYFLK